MGAGFGAGSFGAAALGGGLGSLAGGGSLKDAFKSAVISGGTSALLGGAKSMMGGKSFGQGVMNTFNPVNAPSAGLQFDRLTSGDSQQLLDFIGTSPEGKSFNPMGFGSSDPIEVSETVNFPPKSNVSAAWELAKTPVGPFGSPGSKYVPLTSSYQSSAPVTNLLGEQKLVDQAAKIAMETAKKDAPFYSMFTGGPTIDSGALVAADERLLNLSNAGNKIC